MRAAHIITITSLSCTLLAASCTSGPNTALEPGAALESEERAEDQHSSHIHDSEASPLIFTCRDECDLEAERAWAICRQLPQEKRRRCWQDANNAYAECLKKCKD